MPMRHVGQALAILGILLLFSPRWVPLDPLAVRGIALAMLAIGLTVSVLGAVLGNLPEHVRMDAMPDDDVPAPCTMLVEEIEQLGFARLGHARRVHLAPMASLVPLWHAANRVYSTVYVSDGAPGQAHFDFVTVFEPGHAGLTSAAQRAAGVLPQPRGAFLQILPDASPGELLRAHLEGCEALGNAASLRPAPCVDRFDELLAGALRRQRHTFLEAPLRHTWTALWRVLTKSTPALGPVMQQKATRDRLDALAAPHADEALTAR